MLSRGACGTVTEAAVRTSASRGNLRTRLQLPDSLSHALHLPCSVSLFEEM